MTTKKRTIPDICRLMAAFLVVANHVSPLENINITADFILTRVLARMCVPFFLMVTGYYLQTDGALPDKRRFGAVMKKTAVTFGAAALLYLPLNLYNGYFNNPPLVILKDIVFEGSFYHLWYLPAVLLLLPPVFLAWRKFGAAPVLGVSLFIYLIGLGGDSYFGLAAEVPFLKLFYDVIFAVAGSTRFCRVPVFLSLGAMLRTANAPQKTVCALGLAASAAVLAAEALLLRALGVMRHDSMYLALPAAMYFLFSLLLNIGGKSDKRLRSMSMLIYILHPWFIVLVRAAARLTGLTAFLVGNRLVLYVLVCLLSFTSALLAVCLNDRFRPPKPADDSRAWIEISRDALRHNSRELRQLLPPSCRLMAVVKADAYGHGAVGVAGVLQKAGVKAFAVATLSEGIDLRRHGIRGEVLILGSTPPDNARLLRRYRLAQTVTSGDYARRLNEVGIPLDIHIKIDTGMHRLGIDSDNFAELEGIYDCTHLKVRGMFTHLSRADSLDPASEAFTLGQISRFIGAVNVLRAKGRAVGRLHIQESYGILNYPGLPCDYARAGIALYGALCRNDETRLRPQLAPVLSLRARVGDVKWIGAGKTVGYGTRFISKAPMKLAVINVGYADGIPRNSARREAHVLLHGQKAPVVGLICMDCLLVDVTHIEGVKPGDVATLIGRDGGECIRCEDVAESCGTISNELLSRLGARLPRIFV
jgi:serine/alanine racemase